MRVERGICRTVYLVGPWAIKTPRLKGYRLADAVGSVARAVSANQSESQWSGVGGVAPVLHSFLGIVNVYPRCTPWTGKEEPPYDHIGEGWLPRDRKPQNVGWMPDGTLVWLDYDGSWNGCPHERNVAVLTMDDEDD